MNFELLKRLGECQQLPTLPGVVFQLLELCRQEEASLQEAGDLIGSDPALAARVIQEGLRHTDVAARYGGEEFIALLPATQTRGVEAISRRIVRHVAAQSFSGPAGTPVMVTISAGHATCFKPDQCTPESLLRVADEFLYVAKGQGGNQVFPATQGDLLGSNAQVCSERIH